MPKPAAKPTPPAHPRTVSEIAGAVLRQRSPLSARRGSPSANAGPFVQRFPTEGLTTRELSGPFTAEFLAETADGYWLVDVSDGTPDYTAIPVAESGRVPKPGERLRFTPGDGNRWDIQHLSGSK